MILQAENKGIDTLNALKEALLAYVDFADGLSLKEFLEMLPLAHTWNPSDFEYQTSS